MTLRGKSIARQMAIRLLSGSMPYYVINEYPKSGGTWLTQMLADALQLPYHRNSYPSFEPSMLHGHFLNGWGMRNTVVLWRDGRDVMVSWYHHCLFEINEHNTKLVQLVRNQLGERDYENVQENLPDFIEFAFNGQKHPSFSWSDFVRAWHGRENVVYARYEDLLTDGPNQLKRICYELCGMDLKDADAERIIDNYSFAKVSGRSQGAEDKNNFLRKGISGDWENYFNEEAKKVFERHAANEMLQLEYR